MLFHIKRWKRNWNLCWLHFGFKEHCRAFRPSFWKCSSPNQCLRTSKKFWEWLVGNAGRWVGFVFWSCRCQCLSLQRRVEVLLLYFFLSLLFYFLLSLLLYFFLSLLLYLLICLLAWVPFAAAFWKWFWPSLGEWTWWSCRPSWPESGWAALGPPPPLGPDWNRIPIPRPVLSSHIKVSSFSECVQSLP